MIELQEKLSTGDNSKHNLGDDKAKEAKTMLIKIM